MKKLSVIISLLLIVTIGYAEIEGMAKSRIDRFEGGMVSNYLDTSLADNQFASMLNVVINSVGKVSKRNGQDLFVDDLGSTPFRGIGRFDPDKNTSYLVAASGTNVIRAEASSSDWTLASPTTAGLTSGKNTEFVQADNVVFVLNGYDATSWYNGSAFTGGGIYPASPPTATTGAWLRNYLFLGGATNEPDWIYVSNNLDPFAFDADDVVKINTGDGQIIQHIEAYRLNELIIYKERSIFVLDITGNPPSVCTTDCWTVQPISTVIGTIAPRSVVSLGNDQWFLSSEPIAVRSLVRSQYDKILVDMVSQTIQDIFDGLGDFAINRTHIDKAAGVLFDNKYLLAVPTGTSEVNNTVAVYDFIAKGWYLITGWYPADWVVFDSRLFYIDANDGRVIECFAGTDGDWSKGPNFIDASSTPTVGIDFEVVTKGLEFDYPENYKILDAIETEFGATGAWDAAISISLDDSAFASVDSVNLAGDARVLPQNLPFVLSEAGVARKTSQTQKYGEFKKLQIKISNYKPSETIELHRISTFPVIRPWRRN